MNLATLESPVQLYHLGLLSQRCTNAILSSSINCVFSQFLTSHLPLRPSQYSQPVNHTEVSRRFILSLLQSTASFPPTLSLQSLHFSLHPLTVYKNEQSYISFFVYLIWRLFQNHSLSNALDFSIQIVSFTL